METAGIPPPKPPAPPIQPRCWKCGYELTGIRVDGQCPECGTTIWSGSAVGQTSSQATTAMVLGIVGLALCVSCLGPISLAMAIPAIVIGGKVLKQGSFVPAAANSIGMAKAGVICGWVTVALGMIIGVLWIVAIVA